MVKKVSTPVKIGLIILGVGVLISGLGTSQQIGNLGFYGLVIAFFGLFIYLAYSFGGFGNKDIKMPPDNKRKNKKYK